MFFYPILVLHILLCIVLIVLVLLQQGKGANMGAAFGGTSNTLFGAGGATNALVRGTTIIAILFMITSVVLINNFQTRSARGHAKDPLQGSVMEGQVNSTNSSIELVTPAAKVEDAAPAIPAPVAPPAVVPPGAPAQAAK